jgi:inner membrane protein
VEAEMNRLGHIGFTLLVLSPFMSRLGIHFVLFAAAFAILPDIDILLRVKHREYTHNITFAVVATIAAFFLFRMARVKEILALSAFVAVVIHIVADSFTMQKFPPFFPFSKKRVAFRVFKSNNPVINASSFILGSLSFVYFASGGGYVGL